MALVHSYQPGFMTGRGMDIKIQRLFPHMDVAISDSRKSIECTYVWAVLRKFGFGPRFIAWLRILYSAPTAEVRTNNSLTAPFP